MSHPNRATTLHLARLDLAELSAQARSMVASMHEMAISLRRFEDAIAEADVEFELQIEERLANGGPDIPPPWVPTKA